MGRRLLLACAGLVSGLACAGCSLSYQFDSMFDKGGNGDSLTTGSIAAPPAGAKPATAMPPEVDLAITKAAAIELLSRGAKDSSQPWENPATGARGTVTPIATAYTLNGSTCRDFLASYVHGGNEAWLQGEACRDKKGPWEVRQIKPWNRS